MGFLGLEPQTGFGVEPQSGFLAPTRKRNSKKTAVFWNSLSLEITVHGTHEVRLPVLKVCIWEYLTLCDNPQLGIPFIFVPKEIS